MPEPASETGGALDSLVGVLDPLVDADLRGALGDAGCVLAHRYTFCRAGVPRSPLGRTSITPIRIPKTTRSETLPFR